MLWLLLLSAPLDPLVGCEIFGPDAGAERTLSCAGASALVTRDGPAFTEAALVEGMKRALAPERAAWEETSVRLGDREQRALKRADAKALPSLVVVIAAGEGRVRGVACESRDARWCEAVVASIARALPAPTRASPEAERAAKLAGRAVAVPEGCADKAPGLVACADHSFSFANLPETDPSDLDLMAPGLIEGLSKLGRVGSENKRCAVEGVEATCRVFTIVRGDQSRAHVVAAFASVRKERVYVQCNSSVGVEPMPVACRAIRLGTATGTGTGG